MCPHCVGWTVVQEFGTGIESPVVMIELYRERRRTILVLI